MSQLRIELPDSVSTEEALLELAIGLFRLGRLTQGEAAKVAGLSRATFLEFLAKRHEPFTNIDESDLEEELATWRSLVSPTAHQ